jgi:DNA-binding transcriptional ArsR family regulator
MNEANHNLQGAFRALADPTRRQILRLLSNDDMTIGDVVDKFSVTRGAIKKHLNVLEAGRLISVHPRGRERVNRLEPSMLKTVSEWLNFFDQFWDQKLDRLQQAVNKEQGSK